MFETKEMSVYLGIGATTLLGLFSLYVVKNRKRGVESNRNVVITGGSRGIGYAMAVEFVKRGNNVK